MTTQVKKIWLLSLTLVSFGMPLLFKLHSSISKVPNVAPPPPKTISYEQRTLPQSVVHILSIPTDSRFLITPAISDKVATVDEFSKQHRVKAILNAGFFDPVNQKSTSHVMISGRVVANPQDNPRLINNPNLKPYLSKIFNRTEFRRYLCGETVTYDITPHNESPLAGCQLLDAVGGGPNLLPELTSEQEGFVDKVNGRDAIDSNRPSSRTAIGITDDGNILLVMVAQKPNVRLAKSGMSLPELAAFMQTLGAKKAMNLDGGSSSSLYYNGKTFYGKLNLVRKPIKRQVKSVLLVQEN
ncbi:phosphodiester glycosidase family protein [Calothrix sp. FACHB-1219]|uniref:phosphodiester glycosidase family protein n=1 Tax=unclassified Calothrix TaxID=2619626 RepID=UPI001688DAD7|nr:MULTISPECIES: phosphodiester glycosidase family protein [unclassified Calothrix]MBD2206338.1 phosphodiester glycosidase family protein [Calothrix sp. FACHB-168]MBD2221120.1 phosphodiester glycosidase family protein [Calothrix sp. FACHB-1219]